MSALTQMYKGKRLGLDDLVGFRPSRVHHLVCQSQIHKQCLLGPYSCEFLFRGSVVLNLTLSSKFP